jgi:lysophospholipase L1-like esterase
VVSPHPGGGRRLVGRLALALVAVTALAAGCAGHESDRVRRLPRDKNAALLYVALGDSTVEGIGASRPGAEYVARVHGKLRGIYPRAGLVNLGVGGATSLDVVDDQLERAILLRPRLVTLSIGPNDITGRVPVATYQRNVDTILGRLTRESTAVIVVNLLPDLAITPRFRGQESAGNVGRLTVQFNDALARVARTYDAEVVDLFRPSRAEVPAHPELIAADGYHPSDRGYERWAELVWAGIARRLTAR